MAKTITTGFISQTINGIKINTNIPCNSKNYSNQSSRNVSYIVMHYTGNKKDSAKNNALYFKNNTVEASAHFFVDNTSIYQSVELKDKAWHCGGNTYYHNECRNSNSFGIEMCCTAGNYKIATKTIENSAYLCAYLCKEIGITANTVDTYVLRHYDITHKKCPAQMVDDIKEWKSFKAKVKAILKESPANTANNIAKTTSKFSSKVFVWQQSAVKDGYKFASGVDGIWGKECEDVAKKAICKKPKVKGLYTNRNLTKFVQKQLGFTGGNIDGKFWNNTRNAVITYQKKVGFTGKDADGVVGYNTWKKILGVK